MITYHVYVVGQVQSKADLTALAQMDTNAKFIAAKALLRSSANREWLADDLPALHQWYKYRTHQIERNSEEWEKVQNWSSWYCGPSREETIGRARLKGLSASVSIRSW